MTQTDNASVGGYAFTFEKDALETLRGYISTLESHYLSMEGGSEIMEGIEERIAELLTERCKGGVVTLSYVMEVMDIVGRPDAIEADDPETGESAGAKQKKLYRDLAGKRLGGVCSGLAAYFGLDTAWIRLAFIVLTFVTFFAGSYSGVYSLAVPVIYCVLWVCMPAARTAQERWAMSGDSGKADEIKRNVQAGIHEMGEAVREVGKSSFASNLFKAIVVVVGIVFIITGSSGLASVSVLSLKGADLFGVQYAQALEWLSQNAPVFLNMLETPWIVALLALAVILPFVGILYGGVMMLFGFKSPSWKPGLVIFILWLVIMVSLGVLLFAGAISSEMWV